MKPVKTPQQAAENIKDGASVMIGGFISCGRPSEVLEALFEKGVKDLTIISNDTSKEETGIIKLVLAGRVSKFIGSYIGMNRIMGEKMKSGEVKVELVPQGTFVERVRAAGAGLGGVLTPTGLGTAIAEGKEVMTIEGKKYLLEKPLRADFAIVRANKADKYGNAFAAGSSKNFNVAMAMAADTVILETEEIVEPGQLDPEKVTFPCVFIDTLVPVAKAVMGRN
ncbi:MAG: branched-chain amino acid dehydrogenase [Elusimicrobia bacterium CG_4_10_14_0_2_um_filter_56_8]|nr:MAG: branched-chain amino acid dehydrogenase [Elusimicrobia bacterium CG1_02_56_21]PJA14289.1 MAG: branched-chain amino acid dehydrogenase [Elusimicrobia bacterium CG_4_10_14_0_2_um_filter_56_8]